MIIKHDEIGYTLEELQEALAICGEDPECGVCPFREVCDEDETFIYRAALETIEDLLEKFKSKSLLLSYMEVSLADALASVKDAVETMDEYEERIAALEKENAVLWLQNQRIIEDVNGKMISSTVLINCLPDGKIQTVNSMKYHSKIIKTRLQIDFKYHNLRHPYVKHTTKNISLQKQKSQTTNGFDSLRFLFSLICLE